jgi:tetratricopeptide (TPR) repeat protein
MVLSDMGPSSPEAIELRDEARLRLIGLSRPPEGEVSDEFESLLYKYSSNSLEFYNLGVAYFQKKSWDKAEKAFLEALDLEGGQGLLASDARGYLLALYKEKGEKESMLAQAALLYRENPSASEYRDLLVAEFEASKDWAGLEKAASDWVGWRPKDPSNWRFLALAQNNLNKTEETAKSLLSAAKADPSSAASWLAAAEALEKAGDAENAKFSYQKVLELDEDNDKAGQALLRMTLSDLENSRRSGAGSGR